MVYMIEKLWIDSMENHNAHGYSLIGYVVDEASAKAICDNSRTFTEKDCWQLKYTGVLKEFRYKELEELNN